MEATVRVTTSGPLFNGTAPKIIQDNLDKAITEAVMFLLPKIQEATPKDTGIMQKSILPDFLGKGTPLVKGIIGTNHPAALAVEKGRRPGKPIPKDLDLSRWIMRKFGVDEKTAIRLNYVVKRAISKKGTIKRFDYNGAEMFDKKLKEHWASLQGIFSKYGITIARELSGT